MPDIQRCTASATFAGTMLDPIALISAGASIATAIGVGIAGWQIALAKRHAILQFEDQLSAQYRALMRDLPVNALLGESLSDIEYAAALGVFYHYFDLSNEQAFLHERGRISRSTWESWQEGIEQNLRRPAFALAWAEVSRRAPDSFDELRRLVKPSDLPQLASSQPSHGFA
jgi:hypothetical protein